MLYKYVNTFIIMEETTKLHLYYAGDSKYAGFFLSNRHVYIQTRHSKEIQLEA